MLDSYIAAYFPDEDVFENSVESYVTLTALQRFASYIDLSAEKASIQIKSQKKTLQQTNQFDSSVDGSRLAYGFLNGAVDVFPVNSLPDLCRDNTTQTKDLIQKLFIEKPYILPQENLKWIYDISQLLKNPYGLAFSCMYGGQQVF